MDMRLSELLWRALLSRELEDEKGSKEFMRELFQDRLHVLVNASTPVASPELSPTATPDRRGWEMFSVSQGGKGSGEWLTTSATL